MHNKWLGKLIKYTFCCLAWISLRNFRLDYNAWQSKTLHFIKKCHNTQTIKKCAFPHKSVCFITSLSVSCKHAMKGHTLSHMHTKLRGLDSIWRRVDLLSVLPCSCARWRWLLRGRKITVTARPHISRCLRFCKSLSLSKARGGVDTDKPSVYSRVCVCK